MKKKILIVSSCSLHQGGKAKFTYLYYNKLKELDEYDVTLLENTRSRSYHKNQTLFNRSLRAFEIIKNVVIHKLKFLILLIKYTPDYIQIHTSSFFDFWDNTLYVFIANLLSDSKIIVRYGGAVLDKWYYSLNSLQKFFFYTFSNVLIY